MKYFGNQLHLLIGFAPRNAFEKSCHFRLPFLIDLGCGHFLERLCEIRSLQIAD